MDNLLKGDEYNEFILYIIHTCVRFLSERGSKRPPRMLIFFSGSKVGDRRGKQGANHVFKDRGSPRG